MKILFKISLILVFVSFAADLQAAKFDFDFPDSIYMGTESVPDEDIDEVVDSIKQGITNARDKSILPHRRIPVDTLLEPEFLNDSLYVMALDSLSMKGETPEWVERKVEFTPDPKRAVWLSALFPGLGQVYNRRYWKLPILVGGYLGLAYAMNWNSTMLRDYTKAYADIMDNDPSTKSYMDFFPPSVKEENLDKNWLTKLLKTRKDYFRRNRDLCIISMVGVYLIAMVDAYVDASLAHFDISPDLSLDWSPAIMPDSRTQYPSVGLQWALNF